MSSLTNGFASWAAVDLDPGTALRAHGGATEAYIQGSLNALMSWGYVTFEVHPLNFHEMDHKTGSDWAQKEIAGAAIYREWVGENDETRTLRGKLFPYRIGGLTSIEWFDAWRRVGLPNLMIGGDGRKLGWFVCEQLIRGHQNISSEGVGQVIEFEAEFARVPVPSPDQYYQYIFGLISPELAPTAPTQGSAGAPANPNSLIPPILGIIPR